LRRRLHALLRRRPLASLRRRQLALTLVAAIAAALGVVLLAGAGHDLRRGHVVIGGVPMDEVHPAGLATGERRPGVVVAHGFAGSARLMAPFGDSLAARGYVVVLLDFAGHGADTRPLPDDSASTGASTTELQHDLDLALAHLRALPDVDPARIALVGHSMGATEVTRYAATHPGVTTTVAISLPGSAVAQTARPARLLLLYGSLEFPGFKAAATDAVAHGGPDRRAMAVPGVEHISILYAPETHRATVAWLDAAFGGPQNDQPIPSPLRRISGTALLTLAFLLGFYPLAGLLLPGGEPGRQRFDRAALDRTAPDRTAPDRTAPTRTAPTRTAPARTAPTWTVLARAAVVAIGAVVVAVFAARILPTSRLPIAIGGFVAGYTAVAGALLTAYGKWRLPELPPGSRGWRGVPLIGYAVLAIALPIGLGLTHAVPVGPRWWLLPVIWAGFAVLAYGTERVTGGNSLGVLLVSAIILAGLIGAAVLGLTHGFILLAVPPLALLFLWQAAWSAVLNRFAAPPWLTALTGSIIVAWPLAIALPLVG
jgi:dienelactone hydrolase